MNSVETQSLNDAGESYDNTPYPGGTFRPTHPTHIAMVARLFGLAPPPPRKCRVLELGCAMGSNIIPMALEMPECEFVGIDLSAIQIDSGTSLMNDLGLKNIRLLHKSIMDIDEQMGQFDYILCHGVYSWVPPEVQQKILSIGRQNLSENGLMFVSYNALPGWNLRGAIRDMMRFHVKDFESPKQKVEQARALLNYLTQSDLPKPEPYKLLLNQELDLLNNREDYYILHEHLEDINEPLYFHQFLSRLEGSGLRYLADADIADFLSPLFRQSEDPVWSKLSLLGREQYVDFMICRTFRCSLLCHEQIRPSYLVDPKVLEPLYVSFLGPATRTPLPSGNVQWNIASAQLITEGAETRQWDLLYDKYPDWIAVRELLDSADDPSIHSKILGDLLTATARGVIQLAEAPIRIPPLSKTPVASHYSRRQARKGDRVSSRRHFDAVVSEFQKFLIENSNGNHDELSLATMWLNKVKNDPADEASVDQEKNFDLAASQAAVSAELKRLSDLGFFVA